MCDYYKVIQGLWESLTKINGTTGHPEQVQDDTG
jgi:hypothetical protein